MKYLCVPPYTSDTETTWLPAASDCKIVAVVAEPEEKARAKRACSRNAMAFSKFSLSPTLTTLQRGYERDYLLGLELLVYSYAPTGLPTPDCANVVERDIYLVSAKRIVIDCHKSYRFNDSSGDWVMGTAGVYRERPEVVDR